MIIKKNHWSTFSNQGPVIKRTIDDISSTLFFFLSFVLDFKNWNTFSSRNNIAALVLTLVQIIVFVVIIVAIFEIIVTFITVRFFAPSSSSLPLLFPVHSISPYFPLYHHTSWILAHIDKISKAKKRFKGGISWLKQK